jgi:hypothetical protein
VPALRSTLALAFAAALLTATAARAQPYSASVYNEGPGFRLGGSALVVHPGLSLEGGYDSNVFYLPDHEVGSGLLRLRAHLDLATLPPQSFEGDQSTADPKVDFRFSAQGEYREYLSDDPNVQAQRSLTATAIADLAILPRGPFTLRLNDLFMRTVDPRNSEGPAQFSRDYNRVGLIASYRLGAIEFGAGNYFQVNLWETHDLQFGDNMSDEAQAFARVRLMPQTLLSLVIRAGWVHYGNNTSNDSIPLRAILGASTLVTSWFGLAATVGYGNSFQNGISYNSVIGSAEARFLLPHSARISLGYDRDFFDSIFAHYYRDDRVYVAFEQPIVGRLWAHLDGSVRFRRYEGLIDPSILCGASEFAHSQTTSNCSYSDPVRTDTVYEAHAELNTRVLDWLALGVSYSLLGDESDFAILVPERAPVHYIKHAGFARVDIAY